MWAKPPSQRACVLPLGQRHGSSMTSNNLACVLMSFHDLLIRPCVLGSRKLTLQPLTTQVFKLYVLMRFWIKGSLHAKQRCAHSHVQCVPLCMQKWKMQHAPTYCFSVSRRLRFSSLTCSVVLWLIDWSGEYGPQAGDNQTCSGSNISICRIINFTPSPLERSQSLYREHRTAASS